MTQPEQQLSPVESSSWLDRAFEMTQKQNERRTGAAHPSNEDEDETENIFVRNQCDCGKHQRQRRKLAVGHDESCIYAMATITYTGKE